MRMRNALAGVIGLLTLSCAESVLAGPIDSFQGQGIPDYLSQVNSVSELSDVDPNSWAFQALKNVVERFGCLEGYPNKTYLGNKSLSRYEFAAGLNACLEKVNDLIVTNTSNKASKEDLAVLKRLQEEFRVELAALRGRVDALEAKTKEIESKLFSTNAKLDGSVVMAITGGGGQNGGTIFSPSTGGATGFPFLTGPFGDSPFSQSIGPLAGVSATAANTSFVARTSLNLRATITGNDELLIRLRGVTGQDLGALYQSQASNFGTLFFALGAGNIPYDGSFPNNGGSQGTNGSSLVTIDKIRYLYNVSENFNIYFGRVDIYEFFDTNSFNNEETTFSSGFTINSPAVAFFFNGPGAGFNWYLRDNLALRGLYFASTGGSVTAANGGSTGLFGGTNAIAGELEYSPSSAAHLKFTYVRLTEQSTLYGGDISSVAPQGSNTDIFGFNAEWAINPSVIIFGRYSFSNSNLNGLAPGTPFSTITASTWQGGFGLPNLLGSGNLFGAIIGQPVRFGGGQVNGLSAATSGIENVIELFFRFQVNDRLSITPDIQWVINSANTRDSVGLTVGTLRATFNF
jgi:hypothetical protein